MDFSLEALEYHRLKELLGRYVSTDAGRLSLAELAPMLDEQKLEAEHTITSEAMSYLSERRVPSPSSVVLPPLLNYGSGSSLFAMADSSFPSARNRSGVSTASFTARPRVARRFSWSPWQCSK